MSNVFLYLRFFIFLKNKLNLTKLIHLLELISIVFVLSSCGPNHFSKNQRFVSEIIRSPLDLLPLSPLEIWVQKGSISEKNLNLNTTSAGPILNITSLQEPFVFGRKTNKSILVTPFLNWNWRPKLGNWNHHPISIFVALKSGNTILKKPVKLLRFISKSQFPIYDRGIFIIWGNKTMSKGTLTHREKTKQTKKEINYIVRGGHENTGRWWSETLDIAALYKRAWPNDTLKATKIIFVGIASAPSKYTETMQLRNLEISN